MQTPPPLDETRDSIGDVHYENYEKPIAEVLLFRLAEVRMVPRISIGEGTDDNYAKKHNGSGDWDGDK